METHDKSIVIFDGYCNLCNASVDFILKRDAKGQFLFTANQHEKGKELLRRLGRDPEAVHTVYLLENGQLYEKSTAALRIAQSLGYPWRIAYLFILLPTWLRDPVYTFIANNRYRWMGKKDTCRLPSPEESARFI